MPGRNVGLSCSSPALVAVCLGCSDLFGVYRGGGCVGVCVRVCGFVLGPNSNDFANQILVMSGALVFHSLFFIGE